MDWRSRLTVEHAFGHGGTHHRVHASASGYSVFSAMSGSTRVARQAGRKLASAEELTLDDAAKRECEPLDISEKKRPR